MRRLLARALGLALAAALAGSAAAQQQSQFDPFNEIRIEQKLGERLPLERPFVDQDGREVLLGSYFGERPVVLALVYYDCPMLCNLVLNGVVRSIQPMTQRPGEDFDLVVISIDPREGSELARAKREGYLRLYAKPGTESGWHFLVGAEESIRAVADAVGFRYRYDEGIDEYAHAAGIVVATPKGELARYFYGVEYQSRDLRLALVEASEGKLGSRVDQLLLLCYRYDPTTGKYGFVILKLLRGAAIATVILLVGSLWLMLRRERAQRRALRSARGSEA